MSSRVFYRYNPATDKYERVFPTRASRVWVALRNTLVAGCCLTVIFGIIYYLIETPREKLLRQENEQLRDEIDILNRRLDISVGVMNDIMVRDDNFYRVIMGAPRLSKAQIYAGLDNENRYRYLNHLQDAELIKNLTKKMDIFDRQLYTQTKSLNELQQLARDNKDRINHIPAIQPVPQKFMKQMASGYGYRRDPIYGTSKFHEGLDFAADRGTPVYATADGEVTMAGWQSGYGNMVEITHGYNYVTRYAHLSKFRTKPGTKVKRGDLIGEVGNTGKSTGNHLHYEVRYKGAPQNPLNYYFMDITPEEYDELLRLAENAGHVMD